MSTKLLPHKYKHFLAELVHDEVYEGGTEYFVYTGVHGNVIGDVPEPKDDNRELNVDAWRNMIFGKRVANTDCSLLIRNVPYTSKVFAMADDNDKDIFTKDFFCYVEEGSFFHVYKCLDNNFGRLSTVAPQIAFVTEISNYTFQTSDGYVWKYMYTVTDADKEKFSTQNYFPAITNTEVSSAARRGSIDVIKITQNNLEIPGGGRKYDNYVTGIFTTTQLRVTGNSFLYAISNTNINYQTGFYTGCLLYLSGGVGAGQHALIDDYFTNANGNFVVLSRAFTIPPQNGTTFEIYPNVRIKGAGTETINAVARALVNSTGSNSLFKIEMLEKGENYDYAVAEAVANSVVTQDIQFIEAELRPIYPPLEGHGFDAPLELGCDAVEFSMVFMGSEAGLLPTENRYQQVGLMVDPLFANVNIQVANPSGYFLEGERIFKIDPLRINSNVNISNTTNTITGDTKVLTGASLISSGTAGNYIPGDILTIQGGTVVTPAQVEVLTTHVRTVTINAAGSGYTPGTFNANLNLGTAITNAIFTVTANSIGQCNSITIINDGTFSANPPFLANSTPVEGVAGSGLTVSLTMGLESISISDRGAYALPPSDLLTNEPISNTGTGAGAELLLVFSDTLRSDFQNQLAPGDYIYIVNTEGTEQQLGIIGSITNATSLELTTEGLFSCSLCSMYVPRISTTGIVTDVANSTNILISKVHGPLEIGDLLVGETSSSKAEAGLVIRNDVDKDFDSFIQLYKYNVTVLSGIFDENEPIYQGGSLEDATATALAHSVVPGEGTDILYCSNQVGIFLNTEYIHGANSTAIATISASFSPELEFGSGKVIFIENVDPVNRDVDRRETFQLILTF